MTFSALRAVCARNPGATAAWMTALIGLACVALAPAMPWLIKWPAALTIPASDWIGAGLTWFLEGTKPVARVFSALMARRFTQAFYGRSSLAQLA